MYRNTTSYSSGKKPALYRFRPGIAGIFQVCLALITAWCFFCPVPACAQSFIKVNSGTKSNIRKIKINRDGSGYFLTDKVYSLEGEAWKKVDFSVTGKVVDFDAVSKDDIWFSTASETSSSILYHFQQGTTGNIISPMANTIFAISIISEKQVLIAGYSDVMMLDHGIAGKISPVPSGGYIFKISGLENGKWRLLTQNNELFHVEKGKMIRIFPGKIIKDFCFKDGEHGFLLCNDAILEVSGSRITGRFTSPLLRNAKMINTHGDELWVIGSGGLVMVLRNGFLRRIPYEGRENLNSVGFGPKNDVWIAGDNGLLLYCGNKSFPEYNERYPGFSAHKLVSYGVDIDNEYGVALCDFNNDDMTDIYAVCISDPDRMFINHMNLQDKDPLAVNFTEEAAKRGASGFSRKPDPLVPAELKLGVAVADVDNDGDEDLYLCSLNSKNKLMLNNGKGYFRDVSEQEHRACEDMKRSNTAAFADVDLDGDADLFVTSEQGSNRLFLNDGNGYFTDVTRMAGLASVAGGMCASFSDVNGDDYPDLCVTFWYPSNRIYINETKNGKVRFRDITSTTDLASSDPAKSNAVVFADVNNDCLPDLFIANRFVANKLYLNKGRGIFKDVTSTWFEEEQMLSNGAVFADFDLDGYQDLYVTNVGENVMYRNVGGKYFTGVTGQFGAEMNGYCTGCASGDLDGDGDVDFYASNYINGSSMLFLNKMERRNSVTFKLSGTRSNRDAIGAKIFLFVEKNKGKHDSLAGFREISGGSGYGSLSAREAVFSIDPELKYYALIRFPGSPGTIKIDKIRIGRVIRVAEETGFQAFKTRSGKAVLRFFRGPEMLFELSKFVVVLLILSIYLFLHRKNPGRIFVTRCVLVLLIFTAFAAASQVFMFTSSLVLSLMAPILAVFCLLVVHLVTERALLRRQGETEKNELREKISRDLHDDLASTLGSISIYSSTLNGMNNVSEPNLHYLSSKITALAQTALQSITDIIWMTAPRNDSLQSLLSKVNAMMFEVLTDNMIRYEDKTCITGDEVIIRDKLRHDTFLILKEALNNIIRHSKAQHVSLDARCHGNACLIILKDDGVGFNVDGVPRPGLHGNGLVNMRRRALDSGIELLVHSAPGVGTTIEISFRI